MLPFRHVAVVFNGSKSRRRLDAFCEQARIRAAKLQRHRMLGRIVSKKARAIAMDNRAGGDHLGIDQRPTREQAMEEPAVPVGPFHHRCDGEFSLDVTHLVCGLPAPAALYLLHLGNVGSFRQNG